MSNQDLNYWLNWVRSYHDQAINYSLDNVELIAEQLELKNFTIPVITVAGTNGKGSCIATMEAILRAHGYKVAAYTSPHIFKFNERIRINGTPISEAELCIAMQAVHDCVARQNYINLSYFEFATMAALWAFKQHNLDVILLEVGLGGRLDAVNVVANNVAIITSISLDHCAYLGNTREAIGHEKAGIIKANGTVIYADLDMPDSIGQRAQEQAATLLRLGKDYTYKVTRLENIETWDWSSSGGDSLRGVPMPNFPVQNAAAGLQALSLLPDLRLKGSIIANVFADLKVVGRFQIETLYGKEFIFDVAHNPAAVIWLMSQLAQRPCIGKTIVIVGIAATKDSVAMFEVWNCEVAKWLLCAPRGMRRATPVDKLASTLQATQSGEVVTMETVADALRLAHMQTESKDRIVVFGSFHTVAEALVEFYKVKKHGGF